MGPGQTLGLTLNQKVTLSYFGVHAAPKDCDTAGNLLQAKCYAVLYVCEFCLCLSQP